MKLLYTIDDKNYIPDGRCFYRKAMRAIIYKDHKLAMIKTKFNEYEFPGGGQDEGESNLDTLLREVKEEAGLEIIKDSVTEYGIIKEIRKSKFEHEGTFIMESFYYICTAKDNIYKQNLESYEEEREYTLVFVSPEEAYESNLKIIDKCYWLRRDVLILKKLMEK